MVEVVLVEVEVFALYEEETDAFLPWDFALIESVLAEVGEAGGLPLKSLTMVTRSDSSEVSDVSSPDPTSSPEPSWGPSPSSVSAAGKVAP